jgi:hypothetical protein
MRSLQDTFKRGIPAFMQRYRDMRQQSFNAALQIGDTIALAR